METIETDDKWCIPSDALLRYFFAMFQRVIWIICHDSNVEKQKKTRERKSQGKIWIFESICWVETGRKMLSIGNVHVNRAIFRQTMNEMKRISSGNIWLKQNYEWWMDGSVCQMCARGIASERTSDRVLCSMARRGKHFTYSTQSEWERGKQRNTTIRSPEWIDAIEKCIDVIKVVAKLF